MSSIQFACRSCGKAIEVDADWAHRLVECPYCHDTVTAPGMSTATPPTARKVEAPAGWPDEPAAQEAHRLSPAPTNRIAIVALLLAISSWVALYAMGYLLFQHLPPPGNSQITVEQYYEQKVQDAIKAKEPWVLQLFLACVVTMGMWLAGLICGVVGLFRPVRRGVAVVALAILALPLLWRLL